jgi:hypothetical protein
MRAWQPPGVQAEGLLRTQLANDMTDAFTKALAVAPGSSYSTAAYASDLSTWLAASGRARAELTARYGESGITADWRRYALAVTRYLTSPRSDARRDALLAQGSALVRQEVLLSPPV